MGRKVMTSSQYDRLVDLAERIYVAEPSKIGAREAFLIAEDFLETLMDLDDEISIEDFDF